VKSFVVSEFLVRAHLLLKEQIMFSCLSIEQTVTYINRASKMRQTACHWIKNVHCTFVFNEAI